MTSPIAPQDPETEEYWRAYLDNPDSLLRLGRRVFNRLPHEPRCKLCTAPFKGPGAPLMRLLGKRQSAANPNMCASCEQNLIRHHGGAEVVGTMLFADIRGSTTLAEGISPSAFRALLDRFYTTASQAVFDHDGTVDKFVGDELVAFFFRAMAGERHYERAIDAARDLLHRTGHADPGGPWVPVGAAVHTGTAWFGAIGEGTHVELTAVGDIVNVTARLASTARAGEVLVSDAAATVTGLGSEHERRRVDIRGRADTIEVVSLRVGPALAEVG